jgi:hypothetical protein
VAGTPTYNLTSRQLKFRLLSPFFVKLVQSLNYFEVTNITGLVISCLAVVLTCSVTHRLSSVLCAHMFCDSQAVLHTVSPAYSITLYYVQLNSTQLTRCFNFIFLPEETVGI